MEKLGLGLELDTPAVKQEGTKNQINQQVKQDTTESFLPRFDLDLKTRWVPINVH